MFLIFSITLPDTQKIIVGIKKFLGLTTVHILLENVRDTGSVQDKQIGGGEGDNF